MSLLANYFPILVFLGIAGVIAVAMVGGSMLAGPPEAVSREAQRL